MNLLMGKQGVYEGRTNQKQHLICEKLASLLSRDDKNDLKSNKWWFAFAHGSLLQCTVVRRLVKT